MLLLLVDMSAVLEKNSTQTKNGPNAHRENGANGSLKEGKERPVTARLFFTKNEQWVDAIQKTQEDPSKYLTFYPTPVSTKMRKYTFDEVRAAVEAQNNYTVPLNENHTLHIHFKFAAEIPSLDQNEKRGLEVPSFSVVMELQTKNDQPESQIENSEEVLLQLIRDAATEFKNPKGFHQIEAPTNDRVAFESNFGNTYEAGISEGRLVIAVDNFVRAAAILTDLLPLMNSIVVQAVNKFRNDTTPKSTKEIVFSPPKIGERNAPLTAPQLTKSVKSQFSGE